MEQFSYETIKKRYDSPTEFPRLTSLSGAGECDWSSFELVGALSTVFRFCNYFSTSQRPLQELLAGVTTIEAINALVVLFTRAAKTLSDTASNLREFTDKYVKFIEECSASHVGIGKNLVFVTGEMKGMGVVIDFRGRHFVLTCAHLVGRRSPNNILIQNPHQGAFTCIRVHPFASLDVAILLIAPPLEKGLRLDTYLMSELYLKSQRPNLEMFYLEDSADNTRVNSRKGDLKREERYTVVADLGHVKLGESGSPVFFDMGNGRYVLTGILCARVNERVLNGAQTVEAEVVKISSILQVLSELEENNE